MSAQGLAVGLSLLVVGSCTPMLAEKIGMNFLVALILGLLVPLLASR